MIRADVHSHTLASHGRQSVARMCAAARHCGLSIFGLSEHSPLPSGYSCPLYTGDLNETFPRFVQDVQHCRQESRDLQILLGMELDWIPGCYAYMQDMAARYPFDYVIGGLHFLEDFAVGAPQSWGRGEDQAEHDRRFTRYYEEMTRMAASGLVQIVAHPDFIKVRCWQSFHRWLQQPGSLDVVAHCFETLQQHQVLMEVSSAGLRKDFAEPYPAPALMRLARDLGLEISFASDAHGVEEVGSHFTQLADYARSFGFSRHVVFVNRQRQEYSF